MMGPVKMYIIIIVTLMTMISGSPQSCLHFCKQSPGYSPIPPLECDCSFNHLHKSRLMTATVSPSDIRDSEKYYEQSKYSQTQLFHEQTLHTLNFSSRFNFSQDSPKNMKLNNNDISYNTSKSFAVQGVYDQVTKNISQKYKRNNAVKNMMGEMKDLPLHLYLDIDLDTSENTSQLEELKNLFDNFKNTESDLLDCINLSIYIFSKYSNKKNKSWDYKVEHDDLSNSQEITEIENTCGQPSRIIKHSLYQIKQSLPKKNTSEIVHHKQDITYSVKSKEDTITQNKLLLSQNNSTSTISKDSHSTTYSTNNHYVTSETSGTEESDDVNFDNNYTELGVLSLMNDYLIKQNVFTPNIPINNDNAFLSHTENNESDDIAESIAVSSELVNLRTTTKPNRTVYNEADIQIPRIITKELSNDTVFSVVDGYEEIHNSDFITDRIISTTTDEYSIATDKRTFNISTTNADILKTNKSNLLEIHGNLYVLFGMKQIPARFIQQPNGLLYVAIDGFSFCDQILEENTTNFMTSFCNCIQLEN